MDAVTPNGRGSRGRVTIQQVAEMAGVSVATVSRVLNSHPDVSTATRSAVLKHARELGYGIGRGAVAPVARPRVRRRTRLVGLSVPEIRSEYVAEIVTGAMEALHDRDARLVICPEGSELASLGEQLMTGITDGALLISPSEGKEDLAALQVGGYPVVVIEPTISLDATVPTVAATNWAGARTATEHLIGLGHTHIGIITGPENWQSTQDQVAGYQAALLGAGLPIVPHLRCASDLSRDSAMHAAHDLLSLSHVPSAIFALGSAAAVGVLQAARERKLRVPQDLSVVAFDDLEAASITMPALTAVRQPLAGEGRVGADMLYRLLEGQELDARRVELSTELIIRESTAPPRGMSFLT